MVVSVVPRMQTVGAYIFVILLGFGMSDALNPEPSNAQFSKAFTRKSRTNREYESAVSDLIARTVGAAAENIVVKIDEHLFESPLGTFALTMTASDTKLLISANFVGLQPLHEVSCQQLGALVWQKRQLGRVAVGSCEGGCQSWLPISGKLLLGESWGQY